MNHDSDLTFEATPTAQHPQRWRLHRAGIQNVWFYYDATFDFSGGRCIWRGVNGAGKSRALEMLLPFLLDADRRRMDSTGAGRVRLEDLMKAGGPGSGNRLGYLWLELERTTGDGPAYLTLGALVRFSHATAEARVWYFITPQRVGLDLHLMNAARSPLPRADLTEAIGADRITDSPARHRDRVRAEVFGLTGDVGGQRFTGLMQLLHTLRAPDVGNRIDEGNLTRILSDALPPLSQDALADAGEKLDALRETREAQDRLAASRATVASFVEVYRRYTTAVLSGALTDIEAAALAAQKAQADARAALELADDAAQAQAAIETRLAKLDEQANALAGVVEGITTSERYTAVAELDEKERSTATLAGAADRAWAEVAKALDAEQGAVEGANRHAEAVATQVNRARAQVLELTGTLQKVGVPHQLPSALTCELGPVEPTSEMVRERCTAPLRSVLVARPTTTTLSPQDLDEVIAAADRVTDAARQRRDAAEHRHTVAAHLDKQHTAVTAAEARAQEDAEIADQANEHAERVARGRDETALQLAAAWVSWATGPVSVEIFGQVDWPGTALRGVLSDRDALAGDDENDADLSALRTLPTTLSEPVLTALAEERGEVHAAAKQDATRRKELERTLADLVDGHVDPMPQVAPGRGTPVHGASPLWRAVDFADHVEPGARAGLEAALLASGLLTAAITADGKVRTSDGQVVVTPTGPVLTPNLGQVMVHDTAGDTPAELVEAALSRIGLDPDVHPVAVDASGAWRNGPLHGRHTQDQARYIGAAARQAERAARVAAIEAELLALHEAAARRAHVLQALAERERQVRSHMQDAPAVDGLIRSREAARTSAQNATDTAARARGSLAHAEGLRRQWDTDLAEHTRSCSYQNLPAGAGDLRTLVEDARTALSLSSSVRGAVAGIVEALQRHAELVGQVDKRTTARADTLTGALTAHQQSVSAAEELAQLKALVGADRKKVLAELSQARSEQRQVADKQRDARGDLLDAAQTAGETAGLVGGAQRDGERAGDTLSAVVATGAARAHLPGVWAAATGAERITMPGPGNSVEAVLAGVRTARNTLGGSGADVSGKQVDTAIEAMRGQLDGTFDVAWELTHDVRTVALMDATGTWHVTAALEDLDRSLEEGRAALTEKERTVFTTFVLEGVASELGARLKQAQQLVEDMRSSLRSIHTQQGIGLTVSWDLAEHASTQVRALRDLVRRGVAVRTEHDNDILIGLVKDLVDAAAALDPSAGYAQHLATALDYRAWHKMDVFILGPAPGQRRAISPRSKLSQGEIRFVSYATLFAAVDAFLTGLPDTDLALRLVVLDDAFAKVDNQVVAQFLGLLVNLDLDFALTGHGLWGTVPQVPALDVYEVRRGDGPAVTTHVHWDGHTRHLHPVTTLSGAR